MFPNNTILSCFFLFFLVIDLYFSILTVVVQTFNPIAELVIPIGIPRKEAKAEMEIHPITVETKIRKCSTYRKSYRPFCASYSPIYFALFFLTK